MVFALILIIAIAIAFLASPLIALAVFIVGFLAFLGLAGVKRTNEAPGSPSGDPGSHAAERFREDARKTPSH